MNYTVPRIKSEKTDNGTIVYRVEWGKGRGGRGKRVKKFGSGPYALGEARRFAERLEALGEEAGPNDKRHAPWEEFRDQYLKYGYQEGHYKSAIKWFQRICQPTSMGFIDELMIEKFAAVYSRRKTRAGEPINPRTVKHALKCLSSVLGTAKRWHYIQSVPDFPTIKTPEVLQHWIPPDDFAKLLVAAGDKSVVKIPNGIPYLRAHQWWPPLISFLYMTGMRIGEALALPISALEWDQGRLKTNWRDNKSKRETFVPLHPALLAVLRPFCEQLRRSHTKKLFPNRNINNDKPFKLQQLREQHKAFAKHAGVKVTSFHDYRRGFATNNADHMNVFELMALMGHKSIGTTQKYLNQAAIAKRTATKIYVPPALALPDDEEASSA